MVSPGPLCQLFVVDRDVFVVDLFAHLVHVQCGVDVLREIPSRGVWAEREILGLSLPTSPRSMLQSRCELASPNAGGIVVPGFCAARGLHILGCLSCRGSKVQSAIRGRPVRTAIRINPQSADAQLRLFGPRKPDMCSELQKLVGQ